MKFINAPQATVLENRVAHGECLIDNQDVRLDARRDGEGQPHIHAAGISFDGLVKKRTNLGEALDGREKRVRFSSCQTQQTGVHVDVFHAGKLRIKTGAQFEQRGNSSLMPNVSVCWCQRP